MQTELLQPGRRIPHFEVTTLDGHPARYAQLWQRRNLVLLALPRSADAAARAYLDELHRRLSNLDDTALVAFEGGSDSIPPSTLVICDRWGEIVHAQELPGETSSWPSGDEIVEWVQFVRMQCPECPP